MPAAAFIRAQVEQRLSVRGISAILRHGEPLRQAHKEPERLSGDWPYGATLHASAIVLAAPPSLP
jgi:hypothetical protein